MSSLSTLINLSCLLCCLMGFSDPFQAKERREDKQDPIKVRVMFDRTEYAPPDTLAFRIEITNTSKWDVMVYALEDAAVLSTTARSLQGESIDIRHPVSVRPLITTSGYRILKPNESLAKTIPWNDRRKQASKLEGRIRVQFTYSTTLPVMWVKSLKPRGRPWAGKIEANNVVLDFQKEKIVVIEEK